MKWYLQQMLQTCLYPRVPKIADDTVITTYFHRTKDPQRGIFQPKDSLDYIAPWYRSVDRLELHGLVMHDGLSPEFIGKYQTSKIRFLRVPPSGLFSVNDYRFFQYVRLLRKYQASAVFFTDASDVTIVHNPFHAVHPDVVYVGDDGKTFSENNWVRGIAEQIGEDRYLKLFERQPTCKTVNAGILGGATEIVSNFLRRMTHEFHRIAKPYVNSNMVVFNYVAYEYFADNMSWMLCSEFKKFQNHRTDVTFIHK